MSIEIDDFFDYSEYNRFGEDSLNSIERIKERKEKIEIQKANLKIQISSLETTYKIQSEHLNRIILYDSECEYNIKRHKEQVEKILREIEEKQQKLDELDTLLSRL